MTPETWFAQCRRQFVGLIAVAALASSTRPVAEQVPAPNPDTATAATDTTSEAAETGAGTVDPVDAAGANSSHDVTGEPAPATSNCSGKLVRRSRRYRRCHVVGLWRPWRLPVLL